MLTRTDIRLLESSMTSWLAYACHQSHERMQNFMRAWSEATRDRSSVRRKASRAGNLLLERVNCSCRKAVLRAWRIAARAQLQGALARKEGALRLWQGAHRKSKGRRYDLAALVARGAITLNPKP
jgi:hypothetical protein